VKIVQIVVTDAFAGTERYVAQTSRELTLRGHDVTVIGGDRRQMTEVLGSSADWRPASSPLAAIRRMLGVGRVDIAHCHLTYAEVAAILTRPVHRAAIVSTLHLTAARGARRGGAPVRFLVPRAVAAEVAVSTYVGSVPGPGSTHRVHVVRNGVPRDDSSYDVDARTVVILQRLETEKETRVGLLAWQASGLAAAGWSLVVVGDGSERESLETLVSGDASVRFAGQVTDVAAYLRSAGMLLATAPGEPFGLAVVEAMAAGVPVVASRSGGHLETAGSVPGAAMFGVGDVDEAARCLADLASDPVRRKELSDAGREVQRREFSLGRQVGELEAIYRMVQRSPSVS
jgi:glycosyltransferase involved in cell wall biosynthesis